VKVLAQTITERYALYHADAVEATRAIPDNAIGLTVSSPPFAQLYCYQATERDLSNAHSEAEFFQHYEYVIREMLRITMPGRCAAIHCMDIPAMDSRDAYIGLKPFTDDLQRAFSRCGWIYQARIPIDKNQQAQSIRTHSIGLTKASFMRDRAWLRPALPDYIMKFRKPGVNTAPVVGGDVTFDDWIDWANPTWPDFEDRCGDAGAFSTWYGIKESDTLQGWMSARVPDDERHLCPLQKETVARCVRLWTNTDDAVFDPFDGIGTVVSEAVRLGRRGVGIELKENWYRPSIRHANEAMAPDLFSTLAPEAAP
jgi:DNA modification methylase